MNVKEAIEKTKTMPGLKWDFSGAMKHRRGGAWMRSEISKHFDIARNAWLEGDLETVAEFFGLYV